MQRIETDANNAVPHLALDSDSARARTDGVRRAADAALAVTRALSAAGYEPRHVSVTTSETGELVLIARLEERHAAAVKADASVGTSGRSTPMLARLAIGLILGLALGFLGLPRLELPITKPLAPASLPTAAPPEILSVRDLADTTLDPPTPLPEPTATVQPAPAPASPLFDMPLNVPIPGWTNDPRGTAWFSPDGYRLSARDAGQFVATGIPLSEPVQDVTVSATFRKLDGPPGGGYGLILRDQGPPSQRDGHSQTGTYLVFEVGDLGDVGVWQRDETHWIGIVPWRHSESVHTDEEPNSLVVTARGSQLRFEVNGQTVADLNYDAVPVNGGLGIFVGGDFNEVALERLRIANTE